MERIDATKSKMKKSRQTSKSRSRSRDEMDKEKKGRKKNYSCEIIEEEEEFQYQKFKSLSSKCIEEIKKIPGITQKQRLKDEDGVVGYVLVPENMEAFVTATKVLDCDPVVQIIPSIFLEPTLRQHQFNV